MAVGKTTKAAPRPRVKPKTPARTPKKTATTKKPVKADTSSVSADAKTKARSDKGDVAKSLQDTYKADGYKTDTVKTDSWRKGPNDTIEGMLKGKGFSLKDIYSKDKNGKTMIDKVMGANGLKDPRKIPDGQELKIPHRGDDAKGLSTESVKPGETKKDQVGDVKIKAGQTKDGKHTTEVKDPRISSNTEGGKSTVTAQKRENGKTTAEQVVKNEKGTPVMKVNTESDKNKTTVENTGLSGNKLNGKATDGKLEVAGTKGGKHTVKYGDGDDGAVERLGKKVADWWSGKKPDTQSADIKNAGKVSVTSDDKTGVRVTQDGKEILKAPGDSDDSLIERGGRYVDKAVDAVTSTASDLYSGAKNLFSSWFN